MRIAHSRRLLAGALASFVAAIAADAAPLVALPSQPQGIPYPTERWPEDGPGTDVDARRLAAALDAAFLVAGYSGVPDTRALLAVHHGKVVAERYAPGFGPQSRFQSWSMAKSVTQALVGILVRQRRLDVSAPAPVPAWRAAGDPRGVVTLDHLLHMTSGIDNADGGAGAASFVAQTLFGAGSRDVFSFATAAPLVHPPDEHWAYSTATSMIVAGLAGRAVGGGGAGMLAFMHRELFDPLGMRSATPEFDAAGTFLGGAFMWASARDWARFGLLYLRNGVWDGTRILPEGWVDYTRTRAPAPNNGVYGAHFWLNLDPKEGQFRPLPGGPDSAFCASGNDGQIVMIVPTRDLVLVRLGEMQAGTWSSVTQEISAVAAAFPPLPGQE
ncbi:MAG TPA: serine hydrolase [Solirubrobacteraceae bacterium]|nr:serine hydrolase [Solirubrobacteraceae bacterium]